MKEHQPPRETKSLNLNYRKPGWRLAARWGSLLATLALALAVVPRADATITVTTLDDSGPGSLRQAIADAAPGDTIDFAVTGTITLASGELLINKDLSISGPGATNLTISGAYSHRGVLITNNIVRISGLTVSHGYEPSTSLGGAGMLNWGNASISDCILSDNHLYRVNNVPGSGGGIENYGTITLSNCLVTMNYCETYIGSGAGIHNVGGVTIINSSISGNHGTYGSGLANFGTGVVVNSAICQNEGAGRGSIVNSGSLALTNTTISGNRNLVSGGHGGGIYNDGGMLWMDSCTVCWNATYRAGGIRMYSGNLFLRNSIIANNYATLCPDIVGPEVSGAIVSQDYNLILDPGCATITGVTTHNIYRKDPLLGPLADNGGPTMTHALLPGSPAFDRGSSGGLTTDQRGMPRPFNFPAYFDTADGSDIGAYELQERAQTGPVFTVNSNDDVDDGVPGIAHCSLREAINAANANADTNTITFAAEVPGLHTGVTGTITLTNGELAITNSVNINGPGALSLTVSGNNASRVFDISVSGSPLPIALSGLTIANGNVGPLGNGGGVLNSSSQLTMSNCVVTSSSAYAGGGIYNYGSGEITLFNSTICSNIAGTFHGGGIYILNGSGHLTSSAVVGNRAGSGGGGIANNGLLAITNSTISGNVASLSIGGGGGIAVLFNAPATIIRSCTISSNTALGGGGISGAADIGNSIVAGNTASFSPDWYGTLNSLDYNLIQNTNGCTITNLTTHNIYNQDPKLGPLADLGGPTRMHALRFDSPALDAGNSGGLTTDQRGLPRPIDDPNVANADGGDGSDIGAYEADPNLRITGFGKTGGDIWLSFNSILGRTYRVESSDELPPTWNILTNGVPGTGGRFQALDGGAAGLPKRFYRTVLVLP